MFLLIFILYCVCDCDEVMYLVNDIIMGFIVGFYGGVDEVLWFYEYIEVGVIYVNWLQGVIIGAWLGYQLFGGWKGLGFIGKVIVLFYYLVQYLCEQFCMVVE